MTGPVESTTSDDHSERDDVADTWGAAPAGRQTGRFAAMAGRRGIGWLICGVVGTLAVLWFILLAPGEAGSKADWFFGAAVLCVVLVTMWQTVTVARQANQRAAEAAERLRAELAAAQQRFDRERAAAEDRAVRELEFAHTLHKAELDSRQQSHRAEMDAHRRQADVERTHLMNQLQKHAVIEVSRAVGRHTAMLAALWHEGAGILRSADRDERRQAMAPIFERIGQVVTDFSVELANAHEVVDDARLTHALEGVNKSVLMAIDVARTVCEDIVDGREPEPDRIPMAQRAMTEKAAEARRLAWDLLRTGL